MAAAAAPLRSGACALRRPGSTAGGSQPLRPFGHTVRSHRSLRAVFAVGGFFICGASPVVPAHEWGLLKEDLPRTGLSAANVADVEAVDCFTSEGHFRTCCCQAEDARRTADSAPCWENAGTEGRLAEKRKRCCAHLMEHCLYGGAPGGQDSVQAASSLAPPLPSVAASSRCEVASGSCTESAQRRTVASAFSGGREAAFAIAEARAAAAAAAAPAAAAAIISSGRRAEPCSEMHVYSPKHCYSNESLRAYRQLPLSF
ncbi:unnamed protein product [Polarella glacialis]|uniref:Uncharacterized protein n=1 Tax=Polarella glacialis TaxID=89957 RepID=A0A813HV04_POLGL|nr:unnamed protein product [Polarella glacialis]